MKLNLNKTAQILLAFLASQAAADVIRARWEMGTACEVQVAGPRAREGAAVVFDEIERWDRVLSDYKPDSELSALNLSAGKGPFKASPALYAATAEALRLAEATGGAFDPTIMPVRRRGASALPLVGWRKVRLDARARTIELPEAGMALDFGGIGKGWALDRALERLEALGVTSAMINFGGQIAAIGPARPIEIPGRAEPLELENGSISSSGDDERPGHIFSPFDGKPVRRRVTATIILPSATEADAWSTAIYVLGSPPASFRGTGFLVAHKGTRS